MVEVVYGARLGLNGKRENIEANHLRPIRTKYNQGGCFVQKDPFGAFFKPLRNDQKQADFIHQVLTLDVVVGLDVRPEVGVLHLVRLDVVQHQRNQELLPVLDLLHERVVELGQKPAGSQRIPGGARDNCSLCRDDKLCSKSDKRASFEVLF